MISHQHILDLFLKRGHDGYYLNGHKEVCQWLDENENRTYYIQMMPDELGVVSYNNVRLWSSKEAYEDAQKKRIELSEVVSGESLVKETVKVYYENHPTVIALYEACEKKDLALIYKLKQECRLLGLKFDKQKTDLRRMI